MTRRQYLDSLRNFGVLLLFPFHTAMIWNDFGSRFVIQAGEDRGFSVFLVLVSPWFMPLLFVVAGARARHALERHAPGEFLRRRAKKLLVSFVWGTALLCPLMTLFARRRLYQYNGGLWEHWRYFFTHATDLSGYDGCFTLGHYWFLLFLFLISAAAIPIFSWFSREAVSRRTETLPAPGLLLFFLPVWGMYHLGNFNGYSLGKSLALYLLGYYLLGDEAVLDKLEGGLPWLLGLWGGCTVLSAWLYWRWSFYGDLWVNFTGWVTVLTLFPLARRYRTRRTRLSAALGQVSYPLYLLHQPMLVVLAYVILRWPGGIALQAFVICAGSFLLTLALCLVLEKLPQVKMILGI